MHALQTEEGLDCEVGFEDLSDCLSCSAAHVLQQQMSILHKKRPRLTVDQVCQCDEQVTSVSIAEKCHAGYLLATI